MSKLSDFPCSSCGKCCERIGLNEQTKFLDRGDGICMNFDQNTRLCNIYNDRPLICRVKDYYLAHLSHQYSWEEFVRLNIEVCQILQKE
ncbi:YkgJ family cysteine cluster protein [Avibacterium avium]|uniref:YkgJ family cysteine cluster protein n=1 Tax=Avibacterium avium TaxID=751 RepID=UPI003BF77AA8